MCERLLGKLSTARATLPVLFLLALFRESCAFAQQASDCDPPISASYVAGIRDVYHHVQRHKPGGWKMLF
jgi:hypothetical protein